MSAQSSVGKTIHSANVLYKVDAFNKIFDYISDRHRYPVIGSQSAECLLRDATDTLGMKEVFAPIQPKIESGDIDYYCTRDSDSTFKQVVGLKNLYARFEYCENNGLMPLHPDYIDDYKDYFYCRDDWRDTVCKFYKTNDRRYLMQFWDRGKDTDTERKYLPLEAYGTEPIIDKEPKYN